MSHFKHHVFFCLNQRDNVESCVEPCCANLNSVALQVYAKARVKALGLEGVGNIRINKAGCLDRCGEGPVLVVYPDNVWYTFVDQSDIDEIIDAHLVQGTPVTRLMI